jgi:hypothetical protein
MRELVKRQRVEVRTWSGRRHYRLNPAFVPKPQSAADGSFAEEPLSAARATTAVAASVGTNGARPDADVSERLRMTGSFQEDV